jgi:hypothetical protein
MYDSHPPAQNSIRIVYLGTLLTLNFRIKATRNVLYGDFVIAKIKEKNKEITVKMNHQTQYYLEMIFSTMLLCFQYTYGADVIIDSRYLSSSSRKGRMVQLIGDGAHALREVVSHREDTQELGVN